MMKYENTPTLAAVLLTLLLTTTLALTPATAQDYQRWELPEGATLRLGKGRIHDMAYSPGGTLLAVATSIGIWLYDTATYQEVALLTGHPRVVRSVVFSPDGKTLASGSDDRTIRLWDTATGDTRRTLTGHGSRVTSVVFSPDGTTLASGSADNIIRLWDVSTGETLTILTGHTREVSSIVFSPDGKTLATGGSSGDNTIRLWDTNLAARQTETLPRTDDTIRLWDTNPSAWLTTLTGHTAGVNSIVFSPDGKTLASGSGDKTIRLWDMATGATLIILTGHTWHVESVGFSPDGKTLASNSTDGIRLWDTNTGETRHTLTGHTGSSVVFSPDGTTLASGSGFSGYPINDELGWFSDYTIRLWDTNTGETRHTLTGHTHDVSSVAFSPDGTTLASGSWKEVRLWDTNTGETLNTLTGHTAWVESVVFSPDGKTLASGSDDGTVLLWPLEPPAAAPQPVAEDINDDGVVNIQDLTLVAAQFGQTGEDIPADVNGDGVVDIQDLVLVAAAFEKAAAAPAIATGDIETGHLQAADVQQWLTQAQGLDLANPSYQRGIAKLEQLLSALRSRRDLPIPKETALLTNYPNPFNPETWIPYELAETAEVTVSIHAADGKRVRTLALGSLPAGIYQTRTRAAYWDGRNAQGEPVASGIYFYTLQAGEFTATRKMVIRK